MANKIGTMKLGLTFIFAVVGFTLYTIGVDVFVHDETMYEGMKSFPHQLVHSVVELALLAWQYKFATVVVLGFAMVIVFIRRVPDIKNL